MTFQINDRLPVTMNKLSNFLTSSAHVTFTRHATSCFGLFVSKGNAELTCSSGKKTPCWAFIRLYKSPTHTSTIIQTIQQYCQHSLKINYTWLPL